jgi:hypothetical protein
MRPIKLIAVYISLALFLGLPSFLFQSWMGIPWSVSAFVIGTSLLGIHPVLEWLSSTGRANWLCRQ